MKSKEKLQLLLDELGKTIGLEELVLDEDEFCTLVFDDRIVVNFNYHEPSSSLLLVSALGDVQPSERESIYERMLEANFTWGSTQGLLLSLDKENKVATLICRENLTDMAQPKFEEVLQQFVNASEYWMDEVSGLSKKSQDTSDEAEVGSGLQV